MLFLGIVSLGGQSLSEAQQHTLDSMRANLDYDKTKEIWQARQFNSNNEDISEEVEINNGLRGGSIFNIFMYILIGVAILAMIYIVIRGQGASDKKIDTDFNDVQTEEEFIAFDADRAYREALAAGNYRLALRMRFIKVLQHLADSDAIKWKADKTNRDYTRELRGSSHEERFQLLARAFELVWYGNTVLSEQLFYTYDKHFEHYLNKTGE